MVEGKRKGLTFTECSVKICRFLPLLPTLKMKPLQCNAIGVCTPSARRNIDRPLMSQNEVTKTSGGVWFWKKTTNRIEVKRWNMVWLAVNLSSSALRRFCISYVCPCEWPPWRNKTNVQRQVEACGFGTVPSVGKLTSTSTLGNTAIRRFCTSYASKVRRVHTCDNFQP